MSDADLSKFFPDALALLDATQCKACLVVVIESADRGNGAAPAFAVPNGSDGTPDARELARLQSKMAAALRMIANDLKQRSSHG